jgi:hypothetical protein
MSNLARLSDWIASHGFMCTILNDGSIRIAIPATDRNGDHTLTILEYVRNYKEARNALGY